jgi:succinate-semialdehyde dehydrogenase/glutarate-semialdehyde dehydrogenase
MATRPEDRMYRDTQLFIDGHWVDAQAGETLPVLNPATGEVIGKIAHARRADLDAALAAAERGQAIWRKTPARERAQVLLRAGALLRERAREIGTLMTLEQGKPLAEAILEVERSEDINAWMAGEAIRVYGRSIPSRAEDVTQMVVREPIGVVAAFTPWNFPINQLARKAAAAIAAGCAMIAKGPEETPASCAALVQAYADAGLPPGVLNLVYGVPAEISEYLIPHPLIRKVSFTGSTPVGKHLAALAGQHMKPVTMELGGHAPALVFADADPEVAARALAGAKFRNAGQICIAPTRFLIERQVYEPFVEAFTKAAESIKVAPGIEPGSQMGALANTRRLDAMERLTADAVEKGAKLRTGGRRLGNSGAFFAPTVLSDVPLDAAAMNEEPFGPMALLRPFDGLDEAVSEANRLPYGLAAYAFTGSLGTAQALSRRVESGMLSINHFGLALPETPFGGMKDSGYGFEGGTEAIEPYLQTRFVTVAGL